MSACPVPYFSNLAAEQSDKAATSFQTQTLQAFKKRSSNFFKPYLGLPCQSKPKNRIPAKVSINEKYLSHIFTPPVAPVSTSNSILAQAETPRIVEKQLTEINRPNFFNLAAASTVENLAKVAQKRVKQLNPLSTQPASRKRKKDIFDD
jgi:hypothetical protein